MKDLRADRAPLPRKELGQHFLKDPNTIRRIIAAARLEAEDTVLEIGPGRGALTLPLAAHVRRVVAVEKDDALCGLLRARLEGEGLTNVTLVHGDILKTDLAGLALPGQRLQVMGNLPYNISGPLLVRLLHYRRHIRRAVIMLQREVAERIAAAPGNRTYGALSVLVQYDASARLLLKVPPGCFYPVPKVESMVLGLDFDQPFPTRALDDACLWRVVKAAFAHRRKTLLNSLTDALPGLARTSLAGILESLAIDPGRRAETLSILEFVRLSDRVELTNA